MSDFPYQRVLIAGSSGGIGSALCEVIRSEWPQLELKLVSRKPRGSDHGQTIEWDFQNAASLQSQLAGFVPDLVLCCVGMLHSDSIWPEKRLSDFDPEVCGQLMLANCFSHLALAQAIEPLLHRNSRMNWFSLSAMVGSIGDNQLGGWYSYRMSKAALNMAMKNLSIEWGRRFPGVRVNLVHPGTTDTALSKPFQGNLAADRLYNPIQTAHRILSVTLTGHNESGGFYHWDGSRLPW